MSQITVQNLTLGYEGKAIVDDINFTVDTGDYLCIVGENGSGKSTLMKAILRLRKPMSGTIIYGEGLKAGEIGYLPQQTQVQKDFPASVREIVLSGCQARAGFRPYYSKEEKTLVVDNMKRLDIYDIADDCYRELSGGQQQRVLLARALCATRKVLLLDEPVSGLDPKVAAEMYNLISDINKQDSITIIMISHDIDAALTYADKILHIDDHVFFGTRQQYIDSDMGRKYMKLYESKENNTE